MKVFKNKSNKGFTLIELMIVISIIAFLSSIILVSVKDVREKSQISVFRSEMNQIITALELYKTSTGKYPYEDTLSSPGRSYHFLYNNNNTQSISLGGTSLSTILTPSYINKLPTIPNIYPGALSVWTYVSNFGASAGWQFVSCDGVTVPKIAIYVSSAHPKYLNAVSDWSSTYTSWNGINSWVLMPNTKCYSPK